MKILYFPASCKILQPDSGRLYICLEKKALQHRFFRKEFIRVTGEGRAEEGEEQWEEEPTS